MAATDTATKKEGTPTAGVPRGTAWTYEAGPYLGPLLPLGATVTAAAVGYAGGVNPLWAAGIGAAVTAVAGARDKIGGLSTLGIIGRVCAWGGSSAWLTWALASSPWRADAAAAAVGGYMLSVAAAPHMEAHEERVTAAMHAATTKAERTALAAQWCDRIRAATNVPVTVVGIRQMTFGGGYTLEVRLPAESTIGWEDIKRHDQRMANAARLPRGCGIEVREGAERDAVIIDVFTVNALAKNWDYADLEITKLTVTERLAYGVYRDLEPATVDLLEQVLMVIGQIGKGKSNILEVLMNQLFRCDDAVVCLIDLAGGGLSVVSCSDYIDNPNGPKPAPGWCAVTMDEAILMVSILVQVAIGRKKYYRRRMLDANVKKLNVDHEVPEIICIIDEAAEAIGPRGDAALTALVNQLITIGRAARVRVMLSGVRGTADITGDSNILKQIGERIACKCGTLSEYGYFFDQFHLRDSDLRGPGYAFASTGLHPETRVVKAYFTTPEDTKKVIAASAGWRADFDDHFKAVAERIQPGAFSGRWDRYREAMLSEEEEGTDMNDQPAKTKTATATPQAADQAVITPKSFSELDAILAAAIAEASANKNESPEERSKRLEEEAFASIVEGYGESLPIPGKKPLITPKSQSGPARMLGILTAAGADGMTVAGLTAGLAAEGVTPSPATLYNWLNAAKDAGTVASPVKGTWIAVIDGQ